MPRNVGGGKQHKRRKNGGPTGPGPITYPDEDQTYAIVTKLLGNGTLDMMMDLKEKGKVSVIPVVGRIRGILRKRRVRFFPGSLTIVSRREFVTGKDEEGAKERVDVLHRYDDDHARRILNDGLLSNELKKIITMAGESATETKETQGTTNVRDSGDDGGFCFDDGDEGGEGELDIDAL